MITSTTLCTVPFVSNTDVSRLQMSAKQLAQTVTHINCEIPRVLNHNYKYLSNSSTKFKYSAPCDGEIIYINNDLMIIILNDNDLSYSLILDIPPVMKIYELYSTKLRYYKGLGNFKQGELIYEYDCFKHNIPCYGYNLNTIYLPFFGYNNQDAMILSESAANKCCGTKSEKIFIPIYTYSIFKPIYDNNLKFFPNIGDMIKDDIICYKSILKTKKNILNTLKSLNLTDFTKIVLDSNYFDNIPIISRVSSGVVNDIRIHKVINKENLIDINLNNTINIILEQYKCRLLNINNDLSKIYKYINIEERKGFFEKNYFLSNRLSNNDFNVKQLLYVLELNIITEYKTEIGDKFSNLWANKGLVSLIIPDELRPYRQDDKLPIDSIIGSLSGISRMNFGQFISGLVAKVVVDCENRILKKNIDPVIVINDLYELTTSMNDNVYSNKILKLVNDMKSNYNIKTEFLNSIKDIGLFYECPGFANLDLNNLKNNIYNKFKIKPEDNIVFPKKLLKYMIDKHININISINNLPDEWVIEDVFTAPIYTVKLKQLAIGRSTARDFGTYKSSNMQPKQGRSRDGRINNASKLGQMEFDALLGQGALNTIKELRSVKNDNIHMKMDMTNQIIMTGHYNLPEKTETFSYTKKIIDSLINFLND